MGGRGSKEKEGQGEEMEWEKEGVKGKKQREVGKGEQ